jgi:hypothetical protein
MAAAGRVDFHHEGRRSVGARLRSATTPRWSPLQWDQWPLWGRVGYCASGEDWADCYVLIYRWNNNGDDKLWHVLAVSRSPEGGVDDDFVDTYTDGWISQLLEGNPVEWAPRELDDLIEQWQFGVRRPAMRKALLRGRLGDAQRGLRWRGVSEDLIARAVRWPELHH